MNATAVRGVTPDLEGLDRCPVCKGYGDIWVSWHPTPVQCGHCHGTGKK